MCVSGVIRGFYLGKKHEKHFQLSVEQRIRAKALSKSLKIKSYNKIRVFLYASLMNVSVKYLCHVPRLFTCARMSVCFRHFVKYFLPILKYFRNAMCSLLLRHFPVTNNKVRKNLALKTKTDL